MAKRKSQNEWMAIIQLDQPNCPMRPVVISDDSGDPVSFSGVAEIEALRRRHLLKSFEWFAFNFATGQTEEV